MAQEQVKKTKPAPVRRPQEQDLRTPSGKILKY